MSRRCAVLNRLALTLFCQAGLLVVLRELYSGIFVTQGTVQALDHVVLKGESFSPAPPRDHINLIKSEIEPCFAGLSVSRTDKETLSLAIKMPSALFIGEGKYIRKLATEAGLEASGCLGVLLFAHQKGLVTSMEEELGRLKRAGLLLTPRARSIALMLAKKVQV